MRDRRGVGVSEMSSKGSGGEGSGRKGNGGGQRGKVMRYIT